MLENTPRPRASLTRSLLLCSAVAIWLAAEPSAAAAKAPHLEEAAPVPALSAESAARFSKLALQCVRREYPNKLDHVMVSGADVRPPRDLHPAFYGCLDWHSAVHGHWVLVRLLRVFPGLPSGGDIRAALDENLSPQALAQELAYFDKAGRQSFERPYGWAWLLKLAAELREWDDPDALRWSTAVAPLAARVSEESRKYLARLTYPIRTGVHPNTAFAMGLFLDYAHVAGDRPLADAVTARARDWFLRDRACPVSWEPSGEDFLSPCLEEAALMTRILAPVEFRAWLVRFLPVLFGPKADAVLVPALVSDRSDPKIVHLDGLNMSRARNLYVIASSFPERDRLRPAMVRVGDSHAAASLPFVASGGYEGEHWLATFAVAMLASRPRTDGAPSPPRRVP